MAGQDAGTSSAQIIFATDVIPDKAILHDTDTFAVQWSVQNASTAGSAAFTDRLVITSIPEGCPGSDDQDHPVMYDSEHDGTPADFMELPLPAGQNGALMQPTVGPFPAGSYRLSFTIDRGGSDITTFNCVDIVMS